MNDFEYKKYYVMYAPHPKLYGRWEISLNDEFIERASSIKEAKNKINTHRKLLLNESI